MVMASTSGAAAGFHPLVRCWYGAHSCKIVKSGWMLPMVGPCRRSHRLAAVHCEVAQSLWDHSQVIGNSLWERMNGNR